MQLITMKFLTVLCLLASLLTVNAARHRPVHHDQAVDPLFVWPQPASYSRGNTVLELSSKFVINGQPTFDDLTEAIARYSRLIFDHRVTGQPASNAIAQLNVVVANPSVPLQSDTDESYSLTIPGTGDAATLKANTFYGALHGLETFSQLVTFNFSSNTFSMDCLPLQVDDKPRWSHRGLMLDTSRHYHSLTTIRLLLDSMVMAKYNVFHWHLSDDQSFPYHSAALPRFSLGAYSNTDKYSVSDIADMVEYARLRGIRVMVEFDVPAHAQSWCIGYPEVCPSWTCKGPIDPSQQATFDLLATLFNEVTGGAARHGLFPEDLFHLGGDEVSDYSCWKNTPRVKAWLVANNMTFNDAYRYVVQQAQSLIFKMGRQPVNWDDVYSSFGKGVDPRTIIHLWHGNGQFAFNATRDGYRVLFSPDPIWYLNHIEQTWQNMYKYEPLNEISGPESMIVGGESALWGEYADDSDVFNTIWPRAATVAERLWSPQSVNNVTLAEPRYANFRCLLNRRGIGAAPYTNAQARSPPSGPGPCLSQ